MTFDVAIIGSGFGGSLLACIARRLGLSVVLLEKGRHPRFAIGESSTPLADLLWLELTRRYGLDALVPFAKWGTWRALRPEVACGLKRGFAFYHHAFGWPFGARADRADQLVVAASPRDEIADTHWYRPEFDHCIVREAVRQGAEYRELCEVKDVTFFEGRARLSTLRDGCAEVVEAGFVVDASNHRGPVSRSLGLAEAPLPHQPATEGLFTHFRGVERLASLPLHDGMGEAPFPVDDGAVHHVFDGGWVWVLRFGNGITSAGVAARTEVARRFRFEEGGPAWGRLLEALPTVARQFRNAEVTRPFVHAPSLGFRVGPAAGDGWALLPSAAGFVDPLLSSGFTLTLLGIERVARALEAGRTDLTARQRELAAHAAATAGELLAVEDYVSALYARMGAFDGFTDVARLYFCAVIYAETARRLGRPESAGGLLMREHAEFGPAARACCEAARAGCPAGDLRAGVDALLGRFDLGGLADAGRRPWYPVRVEDLWAGRGRIQATDAELEGLARMLGGTDAG